MLVGQGGSTARHIRPTSYTTVRRGGNSRCPRRQLDCNGICLACREHVAKQASIQETRAKNKKTREEKTKEALEGIEAYFRRKKRSERSKEEVSAEKEASKKRKKACTDACAQSL